MSGSSISSRYGAFGGGGTCLGRWRFERKENDCGISFGTGLLTSGWDGEVGMLSYEGEEVGSDRACCSCGCGPARGSDSLMGELEGAVLDCPLSSSLSSTGSFRRASLSPSSPVFLRLERPHSRILMTSLLAYIRSLLIRCNKSSSAS